MRQTLIPKHHMDPPYKEVEHVINVSLHGQSNDEIKAASVWLERCLYELNRGEQLMLVMQYGTKEDVSIYKHLILGKNVCCCAITSMGRY